MQRFMRAAIGTNNIDNCSRVCHSPTSFALRKSFGLSGATGSFGDFDHTDATILIGANPTEGHPVVGARIKQACLRGMKLVTIDPRRIELADYGVLHLSPRPGTNAAVMLGIAHVIERDGLIKPDFIAARTTGYETLVELLPQYSPEVVEEISGVPAAKIVEAAHIYGEADNACFSWGLGRDRAQVRLRGRAADLQRGADDRQRRAPRRGAAPAARPEQRAGLLRHGRAAGHVHGLPVGRRRGGRAELRGRVGRRSPAREGLHDPADVRRGGRGRPEGDVHLRRGRRADRSEHHARRGRAGEPRVHGLPGHLRDRDDQVRRRDPARPRASWRSTARSRTPSGGCSSSTRRSIRPGRRRPTSRSSSSSARRWATSCRGSRRRTRWTRSPR